MREPPQLDGVAPEVHEIARRGFGSAAVEYERGRPGYPEDAVRFIAQKLGLAPRVTVLDLGAGTGKLTRLLVPTGARVLALEPVEAMRAQLEAIVPEAELVAGVAEAIELPDDSVDAVTAGTAFHWFDTERALREIHRVLRPSGVLALVWNVRDEAVPWVREISRLIRHAVESAADAATIQHAKRMQRGTWRPAFEASPLFGPLEERVFRHVQETDVETQVARFLSVSFVAALPSGAKQELAAEIARHLRASQGETVAFPYETRLVWSSSL